MKTPLFARCPASSRRSLMAGGGVGTVRVRGEEPKIGSMNLS